MTRADFWRLAYLAASAAAPIQYRLNGGIVEFAAAEADHALLTFEERFPPRRAKGNDDETT